MASAIKGRRGDERCCRRRGYCSPSMPVISQSPGSPINVPSRVSMLTRSVNCLARTDTVNRRNHPCVGNRRCEVGATVGDSPWRSITMVDGRQRDDAARPGRTEARQNLEHDVVGSLRQWRTSTAVRRERWGLAAGSSGAGAACGRSRLRLRRRDRRHGELGRRRFLTRGKRHEHGKGSENDPHYSHHISFTLSPTGRVAFQNERHCETVLNRSMFSSKEAEKYTLSSMRSIWYTTGATSSGKSYQAIVPANCSQPHNGASFGTSSAIFSHADDDTPLERTSHRSQPLPCRVTTFSFGSCE